MVGKAWNGFGSAPVGILRVLACVSSGSWVCCVARTSRHFVILAALAAAQTVLGGG